MGCFKIILKMRPDKNFVQREKNAGGKGRDGLLQALLAALPIEIIFSFETGV